MIDGRFGISEVFGRPSQSQLDRLLLGKLVVYNPGIGPFGFNPKHLGREIESYLSGVA